MLPISIFIGTICGFLPYLADHSTSAMTSSFFGIYFTLGFIALWYGLRKKFYEEIITFSSPEDYFQLYENSLTPNIQTANIESYIQMYHDFINSDNDFLFVHSLSGYGKTHLLREFSNQSNVGDEWKIKVLLPNRWTSIEKSLKSEFEYGQKYVIIIDNLSLEVGDTNKIIAYVKENNSLKAVFSFNTCEFNKVIDHVDSSYSEIKINWSESDLITLLSGLTGHETISNEKLIMSFSFPEIIVTKWSAVNKSEFKIEDLYKLVKKLNHDAKSCLKEFNYPPDDIEKFILNLACITPFPNNDEIYEILKEQCESEIHEIKKMIDNLIRARLLLNDGELIRLNSDVLAWTYIYFNIKDFSEDQLKVLITNWIELPENNSIFNYFPKNIYNNLGNAALISYIFLNDENVDNIPSLARYFSGIVSRWVGEAEDTYGTEREDKLEYLQFFTHIVPDRALDLINSYLNFQAPVSSEDYLNSELETENFRPIIDKLKNHSSTEDLVKLIEKLERKKVNNYYGTDPACDLIKLFTSPFSSDYNSIVDSLNILEQYLNSLDRSRLTILDSALTEIFSVTKHGADFGHFKFQPKIHKVINTPELIEIRDKSLEILKKMIENSSPESILQSTKIASKIGGIRPEYEEVLSDQIIKERMEVIDAFSSILDVNNDFQILNEIEDLFLEWWAKQTLGTENVEELLETKFTRDLLFTTSKYFVGGQHVVVEDFQVFKSRSPSVNRWKWFVDEEGDYLRNCNSPTYYNHLVARLNNDYDTIDSLVSFLNDINNNLSGMGVKNSPILSCWVNLNPALFSSLKDNEHSWGNVPDKFKDQINSALNVRDEQSLKDEADKILSNIGETPFNTIDSFLASVSLSSVDQSVIAEWIDKLLENGNSEVRIVVISKLTFIFKDDNNLVANFLLKALNLEPWLCKKLNLEVWLVLHVLMQNISNIDQSTLQELRNVMIEKLVNYPDLEFYEQEILKFALYDLTTFFDFINQRIEKFKNEMSFSLGRLHLIYDFKEKVNTLGDFKFFMDNFFNLYQQNEIRAFLYEPIGYFRNITEFDAFKQQYLENQISSGNIRQAIFSLRFFKLEDHLKDFIRVGESSDSINEIRELIYIIDDMTDYSSISAYAGEVPPDFENKLDLLKKIKEEIPPGTFRTMISDLIERRQKAIENHEKSIQESKYPN